MEIPVTIYTHNHLLIYDLLGESSVSLGDKKQIADGLMLRYDYAKIRKALGIPEEIRLTLIVAKDIAEGVLAGLITSWLLKKLGNQEAQVAKLEIDRTTVELEEDKIKKIIHEKIRKSS